MPNVIHILTAPSCDCWNRNAFYSFLRQHGFDYWNACREWRVRVYAALALIAILIYNAGFLILPFPYNGFWVFGCAIAIIVLVAALALLSMVYS